LLPIIAILKKKYILSFGMKNQTKSIRLYFLLFLLAAIIAMGSLIVATTKLDTVFDQLPSTNRQFSSTDNVEKVFSLPTSTAAVLTAESVTSISNAGTMFPGASEMSRTDRGTSSVKPDDADVLSRTAKSQYGGQHAVIPVVGGSLDVESQARESNVSLNVASAEGSELVIPVPAGEKVPALFLDEAPRPLPQQKMLDRMAAEFNEAVANPPAGMSKKEAWEQARLDADEKYLALFGYAAYNAYHLQAAKEAVRERRALPSAQSSPQ
jgi:hypothetical protein